MNSYTYGKNITVDLAAESAILDLDAKRKSGDQTYNFIPEGILINASADDTVEEKTVIGYLRGNNQLVTLRLKCGVVHQISLGKIVKTGTSTSVITILGNQ